MTGFRPPVDQNKKEDKKEEQKSKFQIAGGKLPEAPKTSLFKPIDSNKIDFGTKKD
jgi:hypothetical protein